MHPTGRDVWRSQMMGCQSLLSEKGERNSKQHLMQWVWEWSLPRLRKEGMIPWLMLSVWWAVLWRQLSHKETPSTQALPLGPQSMRIFQEGFLLDLWGSDYTKIMFESASVCSFSLLFVRGRIKCLEYTGSANVRMKFVCLSLNHIKEVYSTGGKQLYYYSIKDTLHYLYSHTWLTKVIIIHITCL